MPYSGPAAFPERRSASDFRASASGCRLRAITLCSRGPFASIARMRAAWPTATLVHLPVHASWLNQIEIVFSVIQRKVIKPADFADLDALAARLTAFEPRYNATARPFDWRFTRADLDDLIRRIDAHRAAAVPAIAA